MKKLNLFHNRKTIGIFCIAAGLLIVFVIGPLFTNVIGSSAIVVRAKTDIPSGTLVTSAMVESVRVGSQNLPKGVVKEQSQAIGKYATIDISADDTLTASKLTSTQSLYSLKDGQGLLSIPVKSFADGCSGKLQPGDVVSIWILSGGGAVANTTGSGSNAQAQNPKELKYVEIAAVTASNGGDTDAATVRKEASSSANNNSTLPATVTLMVNDRQAQILVSNENNIVHLELEGRGAETKALLQLQEAYFSGDAAGSSSPSSSSGSSASTSSGSPAAAQSPAPVTGSQAASNSSSSESAESRPETMQPSSSAPAGSTGSSSSSNPAASSPSINWGVTK